MANSITWSKRPDKTFIRNKYAGFRKMPRKNMLNALVDVVGENGLIGYRQHPIMMFIGPGVIIYWRYSQADN